MNHNLLAWYFESLVDFLFRVGFVVYWFWFIKIKIMCTYIDFKSWTNIKTELVSWEETTQQNWGCQNDDVHSR